MVASQNEIGSKIGADAIAAGGSAVDAAVATAFALAVVHPTAGNIGGGGFIVYRPAKGEPVAYDFREMAPAKASPTMFLKDGTYSAELHHNSYLAVGVPGTVAGLHLAWKEQGKLPWKRLVDPAVALARDGFTVSEGLSRSLKGALRQMQKYPASVAQFSKNGTPYEPGELLKQPELARTLERIGSQGPAGFYQGETALAVEKEMLAHGGLITREDLKNYAAKRRTPVKGSYRGYEVISMPPASSGGVALIEMLNVLEGYAVGTMGPWSADAVHVFAEAMKRAYADRATFMGDPDAVKMPVAGLISKKYAAALRAQIGQRATPSTEIRSGNPADFEGQNTTHFSVIDRDGNAVSNTYTLNFSYGLGLVAEGTGVLLNNELDDFTSKPGTANAYGLVGYNANLPGPNRRPLSSMTPTIFLKDGKPFLITGSPGGSRIISTVLQIIVNVIDFNLAVDQAVSAPRIHHQWQPDELFVEPGISPEILEGLVKRGYKVTPNPPQTSANSIEITSDGYVGAADRRTRGSLAAGY